MNQLLSTTLSLLIGGVIMINGVTAHVDDIVTDATKATNGANLHQLATVAEVYYSDHDTYPTVSGGEALIDLFEKEGYIRNKPIDSKVFIYEPIRGGQDYVLKIKE